MDVAGATALKYNAVFACLRVLGETLASVPVHEYTKKSTGDRELTRVSGVEDILRYEPNEEMDAFAFKEMGMFQVNLGGNFVCFKKMSQGGKVLSLQPIEWQRVTIERNRDTRKIEYKIKTDGIEKPYARKDLFHVPGPSFDGISGLSPIEYAAQAIRLGLTYEKFSVNFFKNGALPTGIFKHPGALKDEAYARLKADLTTGWGGLANAGRPIIAEGGLDFTPINMKMVDAELLASKRFQVEDICRIYRVPLHLVQNLERATFSNIEQQSLEFVTYTMLPWFKRWEDCINGQLLTKAQREAGVYIEFNMSGLLRGDAKSMAEAFAVGRQWGWLSVNDIRRLMNLNSIGSAGDIYLQPMNMIEAGTEIEPDAAKKTLEQKKIVDEVLKIVESRKT
jgi:HK97 family phage portal protein